MNEIEDRIEIAKKAISTIRKKMERDNWENMLRCIPIEFSYGCVGILDFVKTGNIDRVLIPETRQAISEIIIQKKELIKK